MQEHVAHVCAYPTSLLGPLGTWLSQAIIKPLGTSAITTGSDVADLVADLANWGKAQFRWGRRPSLEEQIAGLS